MPEFKVARTARKSHVCGSYPSTCTGIAAGERYIVASMPPDDEFGNETWLTMKVCARCVMTDEDRALLAGITAEQLVQQRRDELAAWNAQHPVGTPVRYWPMAREGEGTASVTRSKAWLISGGTSHPGVLVDGYAGAISLTHVAVSHA